MRGRKKNHPPLGHRAAIILSITMGFLFVFLMFIGFIFNKQNGISYVFHKQAVFEFIIRYLCNVVTFFLLYELCFSVFRKNWKSSFKYSFAVICLLVTAFVLSIIMSQILFSIFPKQNEFLSQFILINIMKDLIVSIIVFLSTLSISALVRNQQMLSENQRLVSENIRNRYEALKNQLNPHFLFNSLNTLDGLIGFDDDKAHNYLQNLSSSFRYTIQNKKITSLEDELRFVESYAFLMRIRYGDNLQIAYNIDANYYSYHIMPVSLQLLIENAVKHNIVNDKYPLSITIETTGNCSIKVYNNIQPKIDSDIGEGIGLANLTERYWLLFHKEVIITQNGIFCVEIPLIKQIQDNTIINMKT